MSDTTEPADVTASELLDVTASELLAHIGGKPRPPRNTDGPGDCSGWAAGITRATAIDLERDRARRAGVIAPEVIDDLALQLWQAWNRELSGVEPAAADWPLARIEYRRMWIEVARTALHAVSRMIATLAGPILTERERDDLAAYHGTDKRADGRLS